MWAKVKAIRDGRIVATLSNESIYEHFSHGDEVVLGDDGYTIAEPAEKVLAVKADLLAWHHSEGRHLGITDPAAL